MTENKQEALASLQKALALAAADPRVQFRAALVYNHFGDTDRTLQWLKQGLASGATESWVRDTPDFDHLRTDPRFQAILRGTKQGGGA